MLDFSLWRWESDIWCHWSILLCSDWAVVKILKNMVIIIISEVYELVQKLGDQKSFFI